MTNSWNDCPACDSPLIESFETSVLSGHDNVWVLQCKPCNYHIKAVLTYTEEWNIFIESFKIDNLIIRRYPYSSDGQWTVYNLGQPFEIPALPLKKLSKDKISKFLILL